MRPGILLDLQGPKIRLGTFLGGEAFLKVGSRFTITINPVNGRRSSAQPRTSIWRATSRPAIASCLPTAPWNCTFSKPMASAWLEVTPAATSAIGKASIFPA